MVKGVGEGLRIHPSAGLTGVNEQLFLKKPEVMAGVGGWHSLGSQPRLLQESTWAVRPCKFSSP